MKQILCSFLIVLLFSSCVVFRIGDLATSSILDETDPLLVEESLPAFIKTVEILYRDNPSNETNAKTLASLYLLYSNMILGTKAFLLQNTDPLESSKISSRANTYAIKAKNIMLPFITKKSPKLFSSQINITALNDKSTQKLVSMFTKKDTTLLYTAVASIFAVFSGNPLDFETANLIPAALLLLDRALQLDPYGENGRILTLAYSVYAGMPETLGGDKNKALDYFEKARMYYSETNAGLYVDYALLFALPLNDKDLFLKNITHAIDIAQKKQNLMNMLAMQKAAAIQADIYLYFTD
ncbi:MAG TPA: TRAP transporter TatT component family protein [Spirochaetia bacterium]|nr:TRAP transporter TatT component family protein [Spirochaetales bacterium]HRS65192.1 TRAP transporter TatT component family protein [Spirochaetia bacterium]HOT60146.1 TRAP transporter TatT component family protein [Spirochaetales bacterium]HPD80286.1 TRAP transporter TatT component family protein [Spirochaetales bacterium]HQK35420.1 TRAP transporter TatT component family protein [Spirochaetales bacterium]